MILDTLAMADRYSSLHPRFAAAFEFLRRPDLAELPGGRVVIDGDQLFANVDLMACRPKEEAKLECHRRYIDIQYMVSGDEVMGWRPLAACSQLESPYNSDKDYALYADISQAWVAVPPGSFTIFWPEDTHAPLCGQGDLHKIVVKVEI